MALLYGCAGRLTAKNGGFRPGQGAFGTKLLVFGFLYDMPDHCPAVRVQKVEAVVGSGWFRAALAGPGAVADAVVVLAHMDADDPVPMPNMLVRQE